MEGDYEIRRQKEASELTKRELAIRALEVINDPYLVPIDPMDDLQCEGCQ